jgi:DNA-binding LacI/PurR family transcriptional regulator
MPIAMIPELEIDHSLNQRPRLKKTCIKLHEMAEELGPDAKLPTMSELRLKLGTSMQTVNDAVRELEKRSVLRSVYGVGIYVAQAGGAQIARRTVTGNIGFISTIAPDPANDSEHWQLLLAGMRTEASKHKRHLLLIDNNEEFDSWEKVDGVLFCDSRDHRDPTPSLQKYPRDVPRVAVYNRLPGIPSVTADDFSGSYQLTQHLIGLGHRRIAYLGTFATEHALLKQRRAGYLAALEEAGIEHDERWMCELRWLEEWYGDKSDWYFRGGKHFMKQWLERDWRELGCTALMAQNDAAAFGAISSLTEAGISVPGDVSITGFDDALLYRNALPKLTTMKTPIFEIGQTAMRMLAEKLNDENHIPRNISLEVQLIEGNSTAAPSR